MQAPPEQATTSEPIGEVIARFHHDLTTRYGVDGREPEKIKALLDLMAVQLEWRTLADVATVPMLEFMARMRKGGWSVKTHDNHVSRLRRFGAWCRDTLAWNHNRFLQLPYAHRRGVQYEPTGIVARPFTVKEFAQIIAASKVSEARRKQGPPPYPRWWLYVFMGLTGLRWLETQRVGWVHVMDLDGPEPYLRCSPAWTKNKRAGTIPLAPQAVEILKQLPRLGDRLWPIFPSWHTLERDIREAKLTKTNPHGTLCYHSLRKFCATELERAGIGLKTAGSITRHHDVGVLAKVYMQPPASDAFDAVKRLPRLGLGDSPDSDSAKGKR